MKKRQKADDYFNNGEYELSRFGNLVSLRNHLTADEIKQKNVYLASNYEKAKTDINELIRKIRFEISQCDPLMLLMCATDMSMSQLIHVVSESELSESENDGLRLVEYIQSILVSQKPETVGTSEEDQTKIMMEVLADIEELYNKCRFFYLLWAAKAQETNEFTSEEIEYIVEAQLMSNVRGNRYQYFQLRDMNDLLMPHSQEIEDVYGITADRLMTGLTKLEYSLSAAKLDAFKDLASSFDEYCKRTEGLSDLEAANVIEEMRSENNLQGAADKCFGTDLYDVKKVTGWSDTLVDSLSLELGEESTFLADGEYPGWPIQNLPVQRKPFIKISGISYCFDYYNLFDNIYRIIQKNIKEHDKSYTNKWADIQKEASEKIVADKFQKLLPEASVYVGNYYPIGNSLKQMDENDILAVYDDVIVVAEVKAGSFTYTPAITDLAAHKKSFGDLIEKADYQCSRTLKYINDHENAVFYDENKQEKFCISRPYKVYTFCVTVDNFDVFEAKIEKTKLFDVADGTIAISLDDLDVYEEYFESPLCFLHYLKQRRDATRLRHLMLNDELDHLGLYISHNMYRNFVNDYRDCNNFVVTGYREDLDAYFNGLHQEQMRTEKPTQEIPKYIEQILLYIQQHNMPGRVELAEFLLDLSTEARTQFNVNVVNKIKRSAELGYVTPFWVEGDFAYCCFVKIPNIEDFSQEKRRQYAFANMRDREQPVCWKLDLEVDDSDDISWFGFEKLVYNERTQKGVTDTEIEKYSVYLKEQRKIEGIFMPPVKKQKIYPNEPCPCGSGKKYKKCCGRNK